MGPLVVKPTQPPPGCGGGGGGGGGGLSPIHSIYIFAPDLAVHIAAPSPFARAQLHANMLPQEHGKLDFWTAGDVTHFSGASINDASIQC